MSVQKQKSNQMPLILNGISVEELKELFQELIFETRGYIPEMDELHIGGLERIKKIKDPTVYLTRGEVAKQLQISLPTLHSYTKDGYIKSYRIGGKVRYKADDIELALTERNFTAINRKGGRNAAA